MIQRSVLSDIKKWLTGDQYIILKGARRTGKTTIMRLLEKEIQTKTAFLTCDDLEFAAKIQTAQDLIYFLQEFHSFRKEEKFVLFLDEFQYLKNAGLLLKNLYDFSPNLKVIASGSSSLEITKNSEFLTGRSLEFLISPLSFAEFSQFLLKKTITKRKLLDFGELISFYKFYQKDLQRLLMEYLMWGGYPQIVLEQDLDKKEELLINYTKKYLEKDIMHFLKIENILAFNNLLRLLASQIGNLVNTNEIANTLNTANKTIQKYLQILEGTYVIQLIRPFFRNLRSETSKTPKVFFNDLGLRNMLLGCNRSLSQKIDLGSEMENFVFNVLTEEFKLKKINFYRTIAKSEIDFLVDTADTQKILVEVKYRSKVNFPVAFKHFDEKYPNLANKKIVITKDVLKKENNVYYLPAVVLPFIEF